MKIEKFLSQNPSFQIVIAGQVIAQNMSEKTAAHGLNMMEALVLTAIFFEKEKMARPMSLKTAFGVAKSNISHCLRSLERKKLLKRQIHESDARGYVLSLTAKGEALCLQLVPLFDKLQNKIEKAHDERQLKQFHQLLKSISQLHLA